MHTFDRFYVEPAPNHYGINAVQGNAKYIPNYEDPKTWGQGAQQAGDLLSTTSQPAGWSDSDTVVRHVINDFICCGDKQISQIKVGSGAFSSEDKKKIQAGGSHRPYRIPATGVPEIRIPEIRVPKISIPIIPNPRV